MTTIESGSATPFLGISGARGAWLSILVCSARHFAAFSWSSHRHVQTATVTGPSYLLVLQRHLQASVVATLQLTNRVTNVATPASPRPGLLSDSAPDDNIATGLYGHTARLIKRTG